MESQNSSSIKIYRGLDLHPFEYECAHSTGMGLYFILQFELCNSNIATASEKSRTQSTDAPHTRRPLRFSVSQVRRELAIRPAPMAESQR